ncbi:Arabinogalactan peptide, AGP [Parasponia andersonii]|uniref:Arabinogalactan peptide, AGP n=1 Tax=Parasponia andersonii TaxID=3476 RepID=A0A2P5DJ17_PARAD|nr:Arabinogalactan peptide, AGP [Parasponia andersonii]
MSSAKSFALPMIGVFLLVLMKLGHGQSIAHSPAAAEGPSSDGTAIDQGIAYVLLLVALAITYLTH